MSDLATGIDGPRDLRARRADIEALHAAGLLDRAGYRAALDILLPPRAWARWSATALAALGPALILTGIVYFYAFNWADIGRFEKLGAAQIALVCALLGAWHYGLERASGRIALTAAGVLVGVFLAVFGQVYQTGADAWQLFAVWSALILPWCALGRAAGLWVVWLAITCVGVAAFLVQSGHLIERHEPFIWPIVAAVLASFLAARECLAARGAAWASARWHRLLVSGALVAIAAVPVWGTALDLRRVDASMLWAAGIGLSVHAALIDVYRSRVPDAWPVAAALLSLCLCTVLFVYQWLDRRFDESVVFFAVAGVTLVVFGTAVAWLRGAGAARKLRHD